MELKSSTKLLSEVLSGILKDAKVFDGYKHARLIRILIKTLETLGKNGTTNFRTDKEALVLKEIIVDFLFKIKDMHPYGDLKGGNVMDTFYTTIEFLKDYDLKPNKKLYDKYSQSKLNKKLNTLPSLEYLNSKFDKDHQMSEEKYELLSKRFEPRPPFVFYFNPDIELQEKVNEYGSILMIGFFDKNEKQIGVGLEVSSGGWMYQGYFKDSLRHIYGRFIDSSGDTYEGGWDMDSYHGKGEREHKDGRVEVGQWVKYKGKQGEFETYDRDGGLVKRKVYKDNKETKSKEVTEESYYERKERYFWGDKEQKMRVGDKNLIVEDQNVGDRRTTVCCLIF